MGFYVKNGLSFKIVNELSPFEEKIFESLTIQILYQGKQPTLLTCGYRSNGLIPNVTQNQQSERFFAIFDELLFNISQKMLILIYSWIPTLTYFPYVKRPGCLS